MAKTKGISRIVLPVEGMHCASCVAKIEKAVAAASGVQEVSVDLASRTVAVRYAAEKISVKKIRKSIEKAGYDVLGVSESRQSAEAISLLSMQKEQKTLFLRMIVSALLSIPLMSSSNVITMLP